MNAVKTASASNYTTHIETEVLKLITTEDNATLLGHLDNIRMKAVLWAKDATNAAAIIALLTDNYAGDSNTS